MRHKMISVCIVIFLTFICSLNVFAKEFDPGEIGSISISLTQQQKQDPIVGAELSVYYVASVQMNDRGNLCYDYTDSFKNVGIDIEDPELAMKLDSFVTNQSVSCINVTTDENGTAVCNDLELGLYFIKQVGTVEGFAPCTPFVVTVPYKTANDYIYVVDASPKTEVEKFVPVTIKKVWNTDAAIQASDSVTVQLLKNGNVIKTATLNAQNNWEITYTDMLESDGYSIKEVNIPKGFTATYSRDGYVFTVTNTSTLIQTGQLVWPIPVLAISGMILIAVGIVLLQKKRKPYA